MGMPRLNHKHTDELDRSATTAGLTEIRSWRHKFKLFVTRLISGEITTQAQLDLAKKIIVDTYLPKINLVEFFTVDVEKVLSEFESKLEQGVDVSQVVDGELKIIQDPEYRRLGCTVDLDLAIKKFGHWDDKREGLKKTLNELNHEKEKEASLAW